MNYLRRYTLHRLNSRHNPITRLVLSTSLLVTVSAVISAVYEYQVLAQTSYADKSMIAELVMLVDGKANLVERTGAYEVHYSVNKTTYEVK